MAAAIGLEAAIHEGHDFFARAQYGSVSKADCFGVLVGAGFVGINSVMDDVMIAQAWKTAALKLLALRTSCSPQDGAAALVFMRILAASPVGFALQFGIKVGRIHAAVEKFLVGEQWHLGPDILQEQHFTPSGMTADQIRFEALLFEFGGCVAQASARMTFVSCTQGCRPA